MDTIARLHPSKPSTSDEMANPFDDSEPQNPVVSADNQVGLRIRNANRVNPVHIQPFTDGLEWQLAEGLIDTLLSLERLYFARGSVREAEYFSCQARDLAQSLNAPAMTSRALARMGEISLRLGNLEAGYVSLTRAAELVHGVVGPDAADVHRLHGQYNQMNSNHKDAQELYETAMTMLEELTQTFTALDGYVQQFPLGQS